jgi:hypothetical protein
MISVIVWMFIIYCSSVIFETGIKNKGWTDGMPDEKHGVITILKYLLILSAVPVIRVFVVISMVLMATHTKDEWNEMFKKDDE